METARERWAGSDLSDLKQYIAEELKERNIVLSAPPGFGKTLIAAGISQLYSSLLYLARTHREIEYFISMSGQRIYHAYGRKAICIRREALESRDFYSACRFLRSSGRCREPMDKAAFAAASKPSIDEVRDLERRFNICAYMAGRKIALERKRVAATYDFAILNPGIMQGKDLAVFDEYHAILEFSEEAVAVIDPGSVEAAARASAKYAAASGDEVLYRFSYALRSAARRGALQDIPDLVDSFGIDASRAPAVLRRIIHVADMMRVGKAIRYRDKIAAAVEPFPFTSIRDKGSLYLSATPVSLRISNSEHIRIDSDEVLVKALIDGSTTSRYSEREQELNRLLNTAYRYLSSLSYRRALLVFPSREIRDLYISTYGIGENIVVDVAGGRYTEGVDINADMLVMAGAPFPEPSPRIDALKHAIGGDPYRAIAEIRTLQAVGRVARKRGRSVLIDYRFREFKYPGWLDVKLA